MKKYLIILWVFPQEDKNKSFRLILKNVSEENKNIITSIQCDDNNQFVWCKLSPVEKQAIIYAILQNGLEISKYGNNPKFDVSDFEEYSTEEELNNLLDTVINDSDDY